MTREKISRNRGKIPRVKEIRALGPLGFQGLQFHSSWNLNPDRQTAFIGKLGRIFSTMPKQFLDKETTIIMNP